MVLVNANDVASGFPKCYPEAAMGEGASGVPLMAETKETWMSSTLSSSSSADDCRVEDIPRGDYLLLRPYSTREAQLLLLSFDKVGTSRSCSSLRSGRFLSTQAGGFGPFFVTLPQWSQAGGHGFPVKTEFYSTQAGGFGPFFVHQGGHGFPVKTEFYNTQVSPPTVSTRVPGEDGVLLWSFPQHGCPVKTVSTRFPVTPVPTVSTRVPGEDGVLLWSFPRHGCPVKTEFYNTMDHGGSAT